GPPRDRAAERVRRLAALRGAAGDHRPAGAPADRAARGRRRLCALAARLAADGHAAAAAGAAPAAAPHPFVGRQRAPALVLPPPGYAPERGLVERLADGAERDVDARAGAAEHPRL